MKQHKIYLINYEKLVDYLVIPKKINFINDSNLYIYEEKDYDIPFLLGFYEKKYVDSFGLFFDFYYDYTLINTSYERIYIEKLIKLGERMSEFSNPYYGYETYKVCIEGYVFYIEVGLPSQFEIDNPWLMAKPEDGGGTFGLLEITATLFTTYDAAKRSFDMHDFQEYKKQLGINN